MNTIRKAVKAGLGMTRKSEKGGLARTMKSLP